MWPTLFIIDGQAVSTYGVLTALGYLAGGLWVYFHLREIEGKEDEFWLLCYAIVVSAVLGAKMGYWLLEWRDFSADPWGMLSDWRSGWVFWTGFAGTLVGCWLFQQAYNRVRRPRRSLPVADLFAAALALGHVLGRVGCFFEGCCHGRPTSMPWGVSFYSFSVPEAWRGMPLHPVQLYEAFGELVLFLFLAYSVMPRIRAKKYAYGSAFFLYILLYALLRFVMEFFRGDDRGVFFLPGLSPSQWFSLAGGGAAAFILWKRGLAEKHPQTRSVYL